ncbi:MAG: hypothetical protein GZ086_01355 [Gelidibacter sp.]|nr:hypothetical protein [Gelidibacter sp.]
MGIDESLEMFYKFKSEFEELKNSKISETDTRSKILDKIFIEILGWKEVNISREDYLTNTGFYDYLISTGLFSFVIEAKKTFVQLKLPSGNRIKLKTLLTDTSNEEVISQIRSYLIEKGLPIGVISNGHQFIISQFINFNGEEWRNNQAIIFDGFDDIEKRFIEFYELLSFESVKKKGLIEIKKETIFSKKLISLSNLKRKNEKLIRNELSDKLIRIIDVIFREINNTSELIDIDTLNECYVFNKDVEKHHSEMSLMFQDSPPKFDERVFGVRNTINTQDAIEGRLLDSTFSLPNPIILIGGKGAGKTTFINYFFKVSLKEETKKRIPSIYMDFRSITSNQIKDPKYIYQKILNLLYETQSSLKLNDYNILKTIYKKEIKLNTERGLWSIYRNSPDVIEEKINEFIEHRISKPEEHLKSISEYLINPCHKRLCVIFDNVDQLDFSIQKEAFLLSQSIHLNLRCIIIISLREGYFYQWKDKPPFDAFQPNIFHITAPSYREVLKKRIQYVVDIHDFKNTEGKVENKTFKLTDESQAVFFQNLYKTLFKRKNSEILEFLEQTSYPNIRLGLEKFNSFLVSGHTKVETYMTYDDYNIPIWEFIKSVALESNYYYLHTRSKIYNLFHPSVNGNNHFTKLRILYYLINEAESTSYREHYIPTEKLIESFVKCGYNKEILMEELIELLKYGLINCESYISDVQELPDDITNFQITVTQSGIYYAKNIVTEFYYFDLVLQDTPIFNEGYFAEISKYFTSPDAYGKRPMEKRVKCVELFVEYLIKEERKNHYLSINVGNRALEMNIMDFILSTNLATNIKVLDKDFIYEINVNLD